MHFSVRKKLSFVVTTKFSTTFLPDSDNYESEGLAVRTHCNKKPQPGSVILSCWAQHFLPRPKSSGHQGGETRRRIRTPTTLSLENLCVPVGPRPLSSTQTLALCHTSAHLEAPYIHGLDSPPPSRGTSLPRLRKLSLPLKLHQEGPREANNGIR